MKQLGLIFIFPDIHSDLASLEAVLSDAQARYGFIESPELREEQSQELIVPGDYIGKGSDHGKVVKMVMQLKPRVLEGNWERDLFTEKSNFLSELERKEILEELSTEEIGFIRENNKLEYRVKAFRGRDIIITHGHTLANGKDLATYNYNSIANFLSGNINGAKTKGIYIIGHYHMASTSYVRSVLGIGIGTFFSPVVPGWNLRINLENRNELHHLPSVSSNLGVNYSGYGVLIPELRQLHISYCNH